MKIFLLLGSLNAFLGVACGAFGAHGLKSKVSAELLEVWQTGVLYHLVHALGLIMIAILLTVVPQQAHLLRTAGGLLFSGILLFSGSLYLLTITGSRWLGMITPFGGVAFLLGWLLLALAAWRIVS